MLSAVIGFVAVWFNKLSVDRVKLLQALAALQLFVTVVNLVSRKAVGDKVRIRNHPFVKPSYCYIQVHVAKASPTLQVSTFIGPAVLATAVLSLKHVTYLDAATGLFGYFLSENLDTITGVSLLSGPSHHRRTILKSVPVWTHTTLHTAQPFRQGLLTER